MAQYKVFVDGAVGTTGLRIHQRLAGEADITLLTLPEEQRKDTNARLEKMDEADLTFLCLPDDAAREIAALAPAGTKICDASTAHRTLPGWAYGFAELTGRRQAIESAERVAVPGCHATGFLSLATPLVEKGALPASYPFMCSSLSGYSGAGKGVIAAYEDAERPKEYSSPRLYGLTLAHKHLPEMKAVAGLESPPLFCPVIDDYYCGMLVSLGVPMQALAAEYNSGEKVAALLQQYYAGARLVTVQPYMDMPEDKMLAANALAGRDSLEIFVLGSETQLLLCARFDNLGKGASGAAIQCMNLVLGRDETAGLCL